MENYATDSFLYAKKSLHLAFYALDIRIKTDTLYMIKPCPNKDVIQVCVAIIYNSAFFLNLVFLRSKLVPTLSCEPINYAQLNLLFSLLHLQSVHAALLLTAQLKLLIVCRGNRC